MYMKKFLTLIIALLLVACGDSRAKDKELVVDALLVDPDMVVLDFSLEDIECMVDDISDAMDDETWSLYVEAMRLQKAGMSDIEVLRRMDMSEKDEVKIFSDDHTLVNSPLGAYMIKKDKFIKISASYPDKQNRKKLIHNFIETLTKKNIKPIITIKEQIDLMTICFAVDKSAKLNKKIKINYF